MTLSNQDTKVQVFIPCFIDQLFPQTAVHMVQLLREAGCEVDYNPQQTCCGQPAFNAGFWKEAATVGKKFIKDLSVLELPIVCPSSSCVGYVRNFMNDLPIEDEELKEQYQNLQGQIFEFSSFLVDHLGKTDFNAKMNGRAVYHDACAALRECQVYEAPRQLLAKVKGLELVEAAEATQCCGFGGTFAVKFEPISVAMAEKKVENALAVNAEYLISADLSCLMHMNGYIQKKQLPLKVMHLADILMQKAEITA